MIIFYEKFLCFSWVGETQGLYAAILLQFLQ